MFEGKYMCSFACIHVRWKLRACWGFPSVLAPRRMSVCRESEGHCFSAGPVLLCHLCKSVHACSHLLTPAHTWAPGEDFQGVHHGGMVSIFSPWCKIRLKLKSELDFKMPLERPPYQLLNMAHVSSCLGPIILCSALHQTKKKEALCCNKKENAPEPLRSDSVLKHSWERHCRTEDAGTGMAPGIALFLTLI